MAETKSIEQKSYSSWKKDTQDKEEERSDQAAYMALNKNLIEPLMDWKFISVEKIGSRHNQRHKLNNLSILYTIIEKQIKRQSSLVIIFVPLELYYI
jgi:hypothetical protein